MNQEFNAVSKSARTARVMHWMLRAVELAFAAFVTGARAIPLGDNGRLLQSLAAKAARS